MRKQLIASLLCPVGSRNQASVEAVNRLFGLREVCLLVLVFGMLLKRV